MNNKLVYIIGLFLIAVACIGWASYKLGVASPDLPQVVMRNISVHVEDAKQVSDPQLTYSREILFPFRGTWRGYVINNRTGKVAFDQNGQLCRSTGRNDYKPSHEQNIQVTLFEWWLERENCMLPAGQYYVETYWEPFPSDSGMSAIPVSKLSNVFNVYE